MGKSISSQYGHRIKMNIGKNVKSVIPDKCYNIGPFHFVQIYGSERKREGRGEDKGS